MSATTSAWMSSSAGSDTSSPSLKATLIASPKAPNEGEQRPYDVGGRSLEKQRAAKSVAAAKAPAEEGKRAKMPAEARVCIEATGWPKWILHICSASVLSEMTDSRSFKSPSS
eukprot:6177134-Pleurochrysis_carterae.AAC.3